MRTLKPKKEGRIEKPEDKTWNEWYNTLDKKEHEKMLAQLGLDDEEIGEWKNHKVFEDIESEAGEAAEGPRALKKKK